MLTPGRLALVLVVAAGCGGDAERAAVAGRAEEAKPVGPTASASAAPASAGASTQPICPATGMWAPCSVMERLGRAGLAPQRDSAAVRVGSLSQPGIRVTIGSSELDLFFYANAADRERDERRLDKKQFVEAGEQPTLRREATLIRSVNLLALLRSINDRQRERVADALTAGPPQAAATLLPAPRGQ